MQTKSQQIDREEKEELMITPIKTGSQYGVKSYLSRDQIIRLIEKAENKRISKERIISYLKKKGITESIISQSYTEHFKQHGFYEITFNQRPLGFSVIKGNNDKNAIISSIEHEKNKQNGMKIASYIYEINGKRVDNIKYGEILKEMAQQKTPFFVIFKEYEKNDIFPTLNEEEEEDEDEEESDDKTKNDWYYNEQSTILLTPSISPLIGNDVYVEQTDDDQDEEEEEEEYKLFTFGNKYIQKELKKDRKIHNNIKQILLLGLPNSGKSTIMKQIQRVFGDGYNDKERMKFIPYIHKLIIIEMKSLLNTMNNNNKYGLSIKAIKAKEYLEHIEIGQMLDDKICSTIQYLWNEKSIKDLYFCCKSNMKINCNVCYFWDSMDRINKKDYIPSEYDILRVPYKLIRGINDYKYRLNDNIFNIINVDQQRSNWNKWIECFSNVDIIIFVASLNCYDLEIGNHSELIMNEYIECNYNDKNIPEDITNIILKYCNDLGVGSKNIMSEQLLLFEKICNHKSLQNTQIVLCLNKFDLFYKKLKQMIPITICPQFEGYYGSLYSVDSCIEYIRDKFIYSHKTGKYIDCWFMDAMDHKSISRNFNQRINRLINH